MIEIDEAAEAAIEAAAELFHRSQQYAAALAELATALDNLPAGTFSDPREDDSVQARTVFEISLAVSAAAATVAQTAQLAKSVESLAQQTKQVR